MTDIRIGTAPDSWGVWFAEDPKQLSARQFLDEAAMAGYHWIELGPYGYLPTDPVQLRAELDARGLSLSAGTVFERLHQPDSWDTVWSHVSRVAALTAAVGGAHVVVIPEMWRHPTTGAVLEDRELDAAGWSRKLAGVDRLGTAMFEEYGIQLQYHPHADSHVATDDQVLRLLEGTDPTHVSLCLDTGHIAYCGGDAVKIMRTFPERVGYLHLKQVNPAVMARVTAEDLPFGEAVRLGAMIEPPHGTPAMPEVLAELDGLSADVFAIVEQDLYPCVPTLPLPIATRTRRYLGSCGLPTVRFR